MLRNIACVCVCVLLCFVCVLGQLYEGSECVGESDGMKGQCVQLHRCLSVVYDLKRKIHPQICSFRGRDPITCCTDCVLYNDTRNVLVDQFGSHYFKTGEKAADKCLEQMLYLNYPCSTRLGLQKTLLPGMDCYSYEKPYIAAAVGGHDALKGEYPHMPSPSMVRRRRELWTDNSPQTVGSMNAFKAEFPPNECLEYVASLGYTCVSLAGLQRQLSVDGTCYCYQKPIVLGAVGGFNAITGEYPHMALLGYGDDLPTAQWLCGGSVISDRFILTAAHCISSSALGPITYVALGILKRTDPPEEWQRYRVSRIIPHPQYRAPIKYHDIALLQTDTKIKFSRNVLPACLNTASSGTEYARATGWGALGHRQALAETLQVVNLQQFTDEECAQMFPPHRHLQNGYDNNTQSCYGEKSKIIDTCEGDSGGPLQISSELGSCIYKIIGVTSFGRACGFEGNAGMYTRVSYYVPWIESIVWP